MSFRYRTISLVFALLFIGLFHPSFCIKADAKELSFPSFEVRVVDQDTQKPMANTKLEVEWKACSVGPDACYPYNIGEETYHTDKDGRVLLPARSFKAKGLFDMVSQMWWHPDAKGYKYNAVLYFMDPKSQKKHYETRARYLKNKGLLPPEYDERSVTIYMKKSKN